MIVWVNGAFGVGKTCTARQLVSLLPRARACNPELLGWVLKRTVARLLPGDYQHLLAWRRGTVLLIGWAARRGVTVVVPMSVLRPSYLDELLGGLREHGHEVHHVLLDSPVDVLHARIAADTTDPSAAGWRRRHIEVYQDAKPELAARGIVVDTTGATPQDVAERIAADLWGVGRATRRSATAQPRRLPLSGSRPR